MVASWTAKLMFFLENDQQFREGQEFQLLMRFIILLSAENGRNQ